MSADAAADLCRVTVVAERGRFDMAIPATMPLAYLLPTLLRQAGEELPDAGVGHSGWVLQRLGGWPLDTGQSVQSLGIHDGDLLYLRPRHRELPPPVFDDVAEAIGYTLAERTLRWTPAATRVAGLAATGVLLGLGVVLLLRAGPPWRLDTTVAGAVALLLTLAATVSSRAAGSAGGAALLGTAAVPYGFLAGVFALAGPGRSAGPTGLPAVTGPGVVTGASLALITLVAVVAGVGGGEPAFVTAALVTVVTLLAGACLDWTSAAGAAAVAVGTAFLLGPAVPGLAYRLARLPTPFLPTTADQLRQADTAFPATRLSERSLLADRYVTALLAGTALVVAGSVGVLVRAGGWPGGMLALVTGVLAVLRLRVFTGRAQRVWLLGAALWTAVAGAVRLVTALAGAPFGRAVVLLAVVAGALGVAAAVTRPRTGGSPLPGRLLDILEVVLAIATLPLALSVLGVYGYVRSLTG